MASFLLNGDSIDILKSMINTKGIDTFMIDEYASASDGCDKYDCFFRSAQCPCEGICDGKQ